MSAADLPIEILKLHPRTEAALRRRAILTVGQLASRTPADLHGVCSPPAMRRVHAALAERGLALTPGRRKRRQDKSAAAAAPPAAPAIPPLPKIGRIRVRVGTKSQPASPWGWPPPAAPLEALRFAARWARESIGAALMRLGAQVAPRDSRAGAPLSDPAGIREYLKRRAVEPAPPAACQDPTCPEHSGETYY